jgi:hypothetical protein
MRPDYRRFLCDLCSQAVYLCSWCDRGNRYCGPECSGAARRRSQREAGRRYQQTPRGRRLHASRQADYRARKARQQSDVTHQGTPPPSVSVSVAACETTPSCPLPTAAWRSPCPGPSRCSFCGHPCRPVVRHDFLRRRRRYGRSGRDPAASRGRDPAPGHG